jgi:hypothetical protein
MKKSRSYRGFPHVHTLFTLDPFVVTYLVALLDDVFVLQRVRDPRWSPPARAADRPGHATG